MGRRRTVRTFKNPRRIFSLVAIDDSVAAIVVAFADQPAEYPGRIVGIADAAFGCPPVPGRNIVAGNRPPEHIAGIGPVGPPLDPGKKAFHPRPITTNQIRLTRDRSSSGLAFLPFTALVLFQQWDQILRARKYEDVGIGAIDIAGQALVGLSRDRRKREMPPKAEWPIPRARIICERQIWPESRTSRAERNRNG